jgi:low temperature requirement protein LtrA
MGVTPVPWSVPMGPRDADEPHRTATPLELFFDLVFVVAVATAAAEFHHALAEAHPEGALYFFLVFFAIWWAWVNYTWFASAYDSGDVVFRLLSFVIMAGSLTLAAGVPDLFADGQSPLAVAGYVVMRLGIVALWLRAARGHPEGRRTALTYAVGITLVQVFWVLRLALDGTTVLLVTFGILMALELTVPWVAERRGRTPYHPQRIAERYGLFTIIVLGEVVLSSVAAVQGALGGGHTADLLPLAVGGMLVVFSLWWLYFKRDHAPLFASGRTVFATAYGHLVTFVSVAATGAGLAVAVDVVTHHAHATAAVAAWSTAVPIALYVLALGALQALHDGPSAVVPALVTGAGVLLVAFVGTAAGLAIGWVVLLTGLLLTTAVAQHVLSGPRSEAGQRYNLRSRT